MEEDLGIKYCDYDAEKLILVIRKIPLGITKIENIDISMLEVSSSNYSFTILYALLWDISHIKFNNQIITQIRAYLYNGSIGFNY